MTKKDFILIANALADARAKKRDTASTAVVDDVIRMVANACENSNPNFDYGKFCRVAMGGK